MSTVPDNARLPDVATGAQPDAGGALDWVGMDGIDLPVRCADGQGGTFTVPAQVSVQVTAQASVQASVLAHSQAPPAARRGGC